MNLVFNVIDWGYFDLTWPDGLNHGEYSWFHFLFLFLCFFVTFYLCYFIGRKHDKNSDIVVCKTFAIIFVVVETMKLVNRGLAKGYFPFESFPFALCSVPIYIFAVGAFFNDDHSKVRETIMKFGAFMSFVGGVAVLIYPAATLRTSSVYYSIHTLLWHSMLTAVAFYYLTSLDIGKDIVKDLVPTSIGFVGATIIAISLNEIVYATYYINNIGQQRRDELNCFWISRHFGTEYPLLNKIYDFSWPLFIICFILSVLLIFFLIFYITRIIKYKNFNPIERIGYVKKEKVNREVTASL